MTSIYANDTSHDTPKPCNLKGADCALHESFTNKDHSLIHVFAFLMQIVGLTN